MTCDLQSLNWELADLKPPVPRDRLIFEAVLVQGRGQLEVAQEHGISQPRVSKILTEVGAWLCRVLPESAAKEQPEGQLALGFWLVQARLEFLYHKSLTAFDASGQEKVVVKQGKRGEVAWEHKTSTMQSPKVGFINSALRAVMSSSRLCTAAAKSSGNVRRDPVGMSSENPVMSKSAKTAGFSPSELPQTQTEQDVTDVVGHSPEDREKMLQTVIKLLRESPQRAHWTDADFRDAAARRLAILDAGSREYDEQQRQKDAAKAAQESTASAVPPIPDAAESMVETEKPQPGPLQHERASISLDAARIEKLRRERERRKPPEQRRREFLSPLAAG
ncbi:MAG: hypothetical protein K8R36_09695 [Planctomycetales bacterium]|nr:hypothetical protein [Planctomycetales bacterium]